MSEIEKLSQVSSSSQIEFCKLHSAPVPNFKHILYYLRTLCGSKEFAGVLETVDEFLELDALAHKKESNFWKFKQRECTRVREQLEAKKSYEVFMNLKIPLERREDYFDSSDSLAQDAWLVSIRMPAPLVTCLRFCDAPDASEIALTWEQLCLSLGLHPLFARSKRFRDKFMLHIAAHEKAVEYQSVMLSHVLAALREDIREFASKGSVISSSAPPPAASNAVSNQASDKPLDGMNDGESGGNGSHRDPPQSSLSGEVRVVKFAFDEILLCVGQGSISHSTIDLLTRILQTLSAGIPSLLKRRLRTPHDLEVHLFKLSPLTRHKTGHVKTLYSFLFEPDSPSSPHKINSSSIHNAAAPLPTDLRVHSVSESYRCLLGVLPAQVYMFTKRYIISRPLEERDLLFMVDGHLARWEWAREGQFDLVSIKGLPSRKPVGYNGSTVLVKRLSRETLALEAAAEGDEAEVNFKSIGDLWELGPKLGKGSFGVVYEATNVKTGEVVAVKMEQARKGKRSKLRAEYEMMKELEGGPGIPEVYHFCTEKGWNVMVMELLDQCLKDLFRVCDKRFTLKTIVMLADQIIETLQFIHSMGYIHRDMKPQNLMMGRGDKAHRVYLIDFGLSKKFVEDGAHIPYRDDKKGITGTAEYVSLHTHRLIEQSRRDDMESLGYVLMKLYKGVIPWGDVRRRTPSKKTRNKQIFELKRDTDALCKGVPVEFGLYLNYTIGLHFEEEPDYVFLRKLFLYLLERKGETYDYVYDWIKPLNSRAGRSGGSGSLRGAGIASQTRAMRGSIAAGVSAKTGTLTKNKRSGKKQKK